MVTLVSKKKFLITIILITSLLIILVKNLEFYPNLPKPYLEDKNLDLSTKVNYSLDLAAYKLEKTIKYLGQNKFYPSFTVNKLVDNKPNILHGNYHKTKYKSWEAGAFSGLLWKIYALEKNPQYKKFWYKKAIAWSEPLRKRTDDNVGDMAINSLFVFKPWYENSNSQEQNKQLTTILKGASYLAESVHHKKGRFYDDIGVIGYYRKAKRTDNKNHWHAFIDHTINVEQLFWGAEHNPTFSTAEIWRNIAITHIKTLAKNMGTNRNPGENGTWQRGYFEDNSQSANYGKFLFNEGKQGWQDSSTWSRGQAWWIYATSITYQYSQDAEILTIAKDAINYYLKHLPDRFPGQLRQPRDFIPPWDFDYALQVNPKTEKDTSAAAIAMSGILTLINNLPENDPDRQRYLIEVENTLNSLTSSTYLNSPDSLQMSILSNGCYHHYDAIQPSKHYNNGLIWGDYFFIDALIKYRELTNFAQKS